MARAISFLTVVSTLVNYRNINGTLSGYHIILKRKKKEKPNNISQSKCVIEHFSEENNLLQHVELGEQHNFPQ
jgi:ADP-dependent phosphofructokinase/glucokinase